MTEVNFSDEALEYVKEKTDTITLLVEISRG